MLKKYCGYKATISENICDTGRFLVCTGMMEQLMVELDGQHLITNKKRIYQVMESGSGIGNHCQKRLPSKSHIKVGRTISSFDHFTRRISPLMCCTILLNEVVCSLRTSSLYLFDIAPY